MTLQMVLGIVYLLGYQVLIKDNALVQSAESQAMMTNRTIIKL